MVADPLTRAVKLYQEGKLTAVELQHIDRQIRVSVKSRLPSFREFCEATSPYALHDWQKVLCDRLNLLVSDPAKLLIHAPPRVGKSVLVGMRLAPWLLMHHPEWRIPIATYNMSHSVAFTETIRDIMRGSVYKDMAPEVAWLDREECAGDRYKTKARAALRDADFSISAIGIQTGFTGRGADFFIEDDPYSSPDEALSLAVNERTWRFHSQQVNLRVGEGCGRVYMFHRYHDDDQAGRIRNEGGWEEWRFPAIMDANEDGTDHTGREEGEALSPMWSLEHYRKIEADDPQTFWAMYQGRPRNPEGALFKIGDFQILEREKWPSLDRWYRAWDLATSVKEGRSYTAGGKMGIDASKNIYIEDMERFRMEYPDAKERIIQVAQRDGSDVPIGIEAKVAGLALTPELQREARLANHAIYALQVKGDKKQNALPLASRARAGQVFLLRGEWNTPFINEALNFTGIDTGTEVNDQIDAVSRCYNLIHLLGGHIVKPETIYQPNTYAYDQELRRLRKLESLD